MPDRDSVINDLNVAKLILCNPQMLTPEMRIRIGQAITSALDILKEQEHQKRCPCQECHNCMCDEYRIWAGLPEPT